jgi:hypothetical protein
MLWVGLAKRGQRRVEEPPFGLDQFGLDSYVDPAGSNLYWACRQKPSPDVLFGYLNNEQRRPELYLSDSERVLALKTANRPFPFPQARSQFLQLSQDELD